MASTLAEKQIGLLLELVPRAAVIAALIDSSELTGRGVLKDVEATVRAVGRKFIVGQPGSEPEIDVALAMFVRERAEAVYVQGGPFLTNQRERVVALMARHALPAIYSIRQFAELGGLMSYAPSQEDAYRQAGNYVGRILQGSIRTGRSKSKHSDNSLRNSVGLKEAILRSTFAMPLPIPRAFGRWRWSCWACDRT